MDATARIRRACTKSATIFSAEILRPLHSRRAGWAGDACRACLHSLSFGLAAVLWWDWSHLFSWGSEPVMNVLGMYAAVMLPAAASGVVTGNSRIFTFTVMGNASIWLVAGRPVAAVPLVGF